MYGCRQVISRRSVRLSCLSDQVTRGAAQATRIQAAWRGHAARRRFRDLKRRLDLNSVQDERVRRPVLSSCCCWCCTAPSPGPLQVRKAWAADKLGAASDDLLKGLAAQEDELDALFAELDASLATHARLCDQAVRTAVYRRTGEEVRERAEDEYERTRRRVLGE